MSLDKWSIVFHEQGQDGTPSLGRKGTRSKIRFADTRKSIRFAVTHPFWGKSEHRFTNVSWNPNQAEGHSFYCSSALVSKTDRTQFVSAGAGTTRPNTIITIDFFIYTCWVPTFFLLCFVENWTRNMPIFSNFNLREFIKKFSFFKNNYNFLMKYLFFEKVIYRWIKYTYQKIKRNKPVIFMLSTFRASINHILQSTRKFQNLI